MARPKVLCTLELDEGGRAAFSEALTPHATLELRPGVADPADPEAEVLVAHTPPVSRAGLPRLRWLQLASAGFDHIRVDGSWDGVVTTTASGVFTPPIAEYVMASLLHVAQQVDARVAAAAGSWDEPYRLSGIPLVGNTVVLVGYGSIGREVARLARAFRMRVVAVKARPDQRAFRGFAEPGTGDPDGSLPEAIVGNDRLAAVVAEADWVVISLPGTDQTRHLVDAAVLDAMPSGAWLVNVGRGTVVDEDALVAALHARSIGGAVLDVFSQEPLPEGHPLWSVPNAILTPHISGGPNRFEVLAGLTAENLRRLLAGEPLLNEAALARGY
jgi:phosphoglycerate dehydrogenase-like enzyme